jgi:hypothetical protein
LKSYESITDALDGQTFTGKSVTLSAAEVNSGLFLASDYTGMGHPVNTLTMIATETIDHHILTSAPQSIVVTDPPADGASSTSSNSLTLQVSGDEYNGDPQIQVFVDGQQVGGTYNITADHSSGQMQTIQIAGNFDPSVAHQVQVKFVNDAWDGTSWWSNGSGPDGHDLNVYISSISLNGTTLNGSQGIDAANNGVIHDPNANEAVMSNNGTVTFNVPDPPAAATGTSGAGGTNTSSTGTSGTSAGGTGAGTPVSGPGFYVSPNGSDSNPGTLDAPFATLAHAQQAMENSSIKTTYVEAGTYNLTSTITLSGADSGETWQYYPANGVNSAILDGGGTLSPIFNLENASNVTIDGLKLQHFGAMGILVGGTQGTINNNNTIENCDIGSSTTAPPVEGAGATGGIVIWGSPSSQNNMVLNNYVHDLGGLGILAGAWQNYGVANGIDGTVISGNVVTRVDLQTSDNGAIYITMAQTGDSGGHVTITNNYVSDIGSPGFWGLQDIYLDDNASNVTISGNVLGPPNPAAATGGGYSFPAIFVHNGNDNTITDNIIDLGTTGNVGVVTYGVDGNSLAGLANNVVTGNIILSGYSGASNVPAYGGQTGSPASDYTIQGNDYFNYAGGSINTSGVVAGDIDPLNMDPQISGSNYSIAAGSSVLGSLMNFAPITGGWGPPGFVVAQSAIRSDP